MRVHPLLLAIALASCTATGEDTDLEGKADDNGSCELPEYGNGVCEVSLPCGIVDIDCYVTFETDADAAAWVPEKYALLAETDPRFLRGRRLLDTAWELFTAHIQLGKLAQERVGLAVVSRPSKNAFILSDSDRVRAGLVVFVHSAVLEDGSETDTQIIGTMLHELAHLSGQHWLPGIKEDIKRHYVAPEGEEPIGAEQDDQLRIRALLDAWQHEASFIGIYSDARFGSLPYSGPLRSLLTYALLKSNACGRQGGALLSVLSDLPEPSVLDDDVALDDTMAATIGRDLTEFAECWKLNDKETLAQLAMRTYPDEPTFLLDRLDSEEQSRWLGASAVEGLMSLTNDRRKRLREIEATFTTETGRPWTALRYFSTEEQADDTSVSILKHAGSDPLAPADSLLNYLSGDRELCETAIAAGTVPYGRDLSDPHHATCWRVAHARQVAEQGGTRRSHQPTGIRIPHRPRPAVDRQPIY